MLSYGLLGWEKDSPVGWGARPFHPNPRTYIDTFSNDTSKVKDLIISSSTLKRLEHGETELKFFPIFFDVAQKDFAARMDRSFKGDFKSANHTPIITMRGKNVITVKPGQEIALDAVVKEPNGDGISAHRWQYCSFKITTKLAVQPTEGLKATINIPPTASVGIPSFNIGSV